MEIDSTEENSPFYSKNTISEFKSDNIENACRIEKKVLFKVPKNYYDLYFEEINDESTEDLSLKSSNSTKVDEEDLSPSDF